MYSMYILNVFFFFFSCWMHDDKKINMERISTEKVNTLNFN